MKKAFTLIEIIVVVIIIGVLATLGFAQYSKTVEKGRAAEAKTLLGQMRTSQQLYIEEYNSRAADVGVLDVSVPTACITTNYFSYSTDADTGTAIRCTSGGKTPNAGTAYTITVTYASGVWGGTSGYY